MLITLVALSSVVRATDSEPALDDDDILAMDDVATKPIRDETTSTNSEAKNKPYTSPKIKQDNIFLFETFDDEQKFKSSWIPSKSSKYEGKWQTSSGPDSPSADLQLLLPIKARHYAISSKLNEPFKFDADKPLVVQYEVQFREGLDCGGAYVKLLRNSAINDLTKLDDKTPFTIMFGPDKCGSETKLHFIVQYLNPKTKEYSEKHWQNAKLVSDLLPAIGDKKHHLLRLVLEPSNKFEISLDGKMVGRGNLLEDFDPAINPPKEIVDPNDKKPLDWDDRPQIDDPHAEKPDDWDEDAPQTIEDADAVMPAGWLENEPENIPDPAAKRPDDWDEEMDGKWEAALIANPACANAPGCGAWKRPMVANPNYKGKWRAPKIDNPKYKGAWAPRMISNPDYFYDENPFKSLDPIGAVAFELWSMADNIAFDNMIVTSDVDSANLLQLLTWQDKKLEADKNSPSVMTRVSHYLQTQPWLWVVIVLAAVLTTVLFVTFCCDTKRHAKAKKDDAKAKRKKTDEPEQEDKDVAEENDEAEEDQDEDEDGDDDDDDGDEKKLAGDKVPKRPVRQRKK